MIQPYNELRTTAFRFAQPDASLTLKYYHLAFPNVWREPLSLLAQEEYAARPNRGRNTKAREYTPLPVAALNASMRAFLSKVILSGRHIPQNADEPWLYSLSPVNTKAIARIARAWVQSAFPHVSEERRQEIARGITAQALSWEVSDMNLAAWTVGSNGTAQPETSDSVFRLLPQTLAAQLTMPGVTVNFGPHPRQLYRVSASPASQAAELMTWPPLIHTTHKNREWPYSLVITLSVQTIPFQAEPFLFVDLSLRRWVATPITKPLPFDASVHVRANAPWLSEDEGISPSFEVASLRWRHPKKGGAASLPQWQGFLPTIIDRLQLDTPFPSPIDLVGRGQTRWWEDETGPIAAIVYSTRMDLPHGVGPGFMPPDRHKVVTGQIAALLGPDFTPVDPLPRVRYRAAALGVRQQRVLTSAKSSEPLIDDQLEGVGDGEPADYEEAEALSAEQRPPNEEELRREAEKARKRHERQLRDQGVLRVALGRTLGGRTLIRIYHQTEKMRTVLLGALEALFGPPDRRLEAEQYICEWHGPDLYLLVETQWLGALGSSLSLEKLDSSLLRDRWHHAISERADLFAATLLANGHSKKHDLVPVNEIAVSATHPAGVIIEIGAPGSFFPAQTDPKPALRIGAAQAHHLSQFIITEMSEQLDEEEEKALAGRAKQACRDLFRQLGVLKHPPHWSFTQAPIADSPLTSAAIPRVLPQRYLLPSPLHYVGVWLIQQNWRGSPTGVGHILPVLVHLQSDSTEIMATAPGLGDWIPYERALREINQRVRLGATAKSPMGLQHVGLVTPYIEQTLERDIVGDTLLMAHAQNLRRAWSWLKNKDITPDKIQVGKSLPFPISERSGLRVVRVRTSSGHETPECYGEDDTQEQLRLGLTRGLWRIGNRVFASTGAKPTAFLNLSVDLSKALPWGATARHPAPGAQAWNPSLVELTVAGLQPGDVDWVWAAVVHELRFAAYHFDDALVLPLPLHLAKLMEEYVLPLRIASSDQQDEDEETMEAGEGETAEEDEEHPLTPTDDRG